MINEEKVKLMTKIAIYEEHIGKEDLKRSKYYKSDYVKFHVLKSIVGAAIVYFAGVGLYIYSHMEELLDAMNTSMDYQGIGKDLLTSFVIFILVYALFAGILYAVRYEKTRPNIMKYGYSLNRLSAFYEKGELKKPRKRKKKGDVVEDDKHIEY